MTDQEQRTARNFISTISSAFGVDQSYAGADGYAVNAPRQYMVIGPNGTQTEGATGRTSAAGVLFTTPILMLAIGAAAVYLLTQKG